MFGMDHGWNFGEGNGRWDLWKVRCWNSGLVPTFQRHQDVEDSTLLMNSDHWHFWTMNWAGLPDFDFFCVSKIGGSLRKKHWIPTKINNFAREFFEVPNFKTT